MKEQGITQLTPTSARILKLALIKEQQNKCAATGREMAKPRLDHEHRKGFLLSRSGQIRGVIDDPVNQLLGKVEFGAKRFNVPLDDLPMVLRGLADYLEKPLLPFIHPTEKPKDPIIKVSSFNELSRKIVASGKKPPAWFKYRRKKGKPAQKGTKQLLAMYERYGIEPEYYK